MASPPKPWERAGAGGTSTGMTSESTAAAPSSTATATATGASTAAPSLPQRPSTLTSVVNQNASAYSTYGAANRPYGTTAYGASPYGAYGGYSSYTSPYNRFGAGMMGSMYGGYGGYNGGMYGGGYGPGMYGGMPGDPNNPQSLTQSFNQSTQATFQMIEGIVGAFGGFAQMLESTYMATHSSFFAMVSVAEQFGNLRQTLGSVLGIFTIMRWIRTAIAKLTGRPPPASSKELTPAKFAAFTGRLPDGSPAPPAPSKKPFVFFMVAVFGLPFLMGKLIRALAKNHEEEERRRMAANPELLDANGNLDPNKLEFCRVMYDFTPETNAQVVQGVDLAVKKGDLVAVLSKSDPLGNPSEWWRCRSRDGRIGYLPSPYLEPIQRRTQAQITAGGSTSQPVSPAGSRAQTMTNTMSAPDSRTQTMTEKVPAKPPKIEGKPGDISVESFQKGGFYT
ncbi:uncharacterized protein PV09_01607 [Verruconis gallopava]|uniref:Peroxisomal membrane protein PEX13 n=1 Tax=Verruconis gallopava TaxID=253628 RepID=A0A0D1Z3W1_9PEZI|nr:uncharacterized protein PV09_01607 [Verruconis gallopava]KIW07667.1 hypothetical protein PV09_01607 [Verruconis gallopava]